MTTTTGDLIEATRAHLLTSSEEPANRLGADIDANATSIVFKYPLSTAGITERSIISIGLEDIRVWEHDGQKTATVVERHVNGSSASAHTTLDYVYAKSRFTPFRILRALNNDLNDLSSPENGLYQVKPFEFTYVAGKLAYDLTGVTGEDDLVEVEYQLPGSSGEWRPVPWDLWHLGRDQNTTSFPSGFSLTFVSAGYSGQTYRVKYRAPFTPLSTASLTADVTLSGMTETAAKGLLPLGAALEMMAGREVKRNFTEAQPDTRRATEVPAGATLGSANGLRVLRQQRIVAEAARLSARYPTMLRTR